MTGQSNKYSFFCFIYQFEHLITQLYHYYQKLHQSKHDQNLIDSCLLGLSRLNTGSINIIFILCSLENPNGCN